MYNKLITGNLLVLILITYSFTLPNTVSAQSTWSGVHAILQTNCAGGSCHSAASPNPLTLIGTEADIYGNLVDVVPTNPDALSRGYKLVDPGYPHFSFLLKKVNQGLDPDNDLDDVAQGQVMPKPLAPALTDEEIDLINAWILHGAPETGAVVNEQLIADFHAGTGLAHEPPIAAPDPADGFQIHFGSVFMDANSEKEFHLKRKLPNISEDMEITRLETYIDLESHHYIIYKFDNQGAADAVSVGLREVTGLADAFVNGTSMVAAWQNESDIILPNGTAYFWDPGTILDMNLHIRNYSPDSILKAEVYTNVYLAPRQTNTVEMISDLVLFSTLPITVPCGLNPFCIPNDGQDYTFTGDMTNNDLSSGNADSIYVWLLSSHTHKFGTGFDIYLRNSGGGKGQKVYDGFYNFDYSFYQGFYDYEDPPVRYFDIDTFAVKAGDGFIQEATFNNDSTQDVAFGLTTDDEMMLTFFQYTTERATTSTTDISTLNKSSNFSVYPNPSSGNAPVSFTRPNAAGEDFLTLYDLLGKEVLVQQFPTGMKQLFLDKSNLKAGVYMYKAWSAKGEIASGKLVMY